MTHKKHTYIATLRHYNGCKWISRHTSYHIAAYGATVYEVDITTSYYTRRWVMCAAFEKKLTYSVLIHTVCLQ